MANHFTIRQAKREDSQLIFDFIQAIAAYEKMSDDVEGSVSDVEYSIFDKEQASVLIGEEDGIPVGFALYYFNYSTFKTRRGLYLEDLFVNPNMRGKSYGKLLLMELVNIAAQQNCGRMEWCCLDWNTPSIKFYKSLGATAMDEWTTYRLNEEQIAKFASEECN